jgi:hypothetical protein
MYPLNGPHRKHLSQQLSPSHSQSYVTTDISRQPSFVSSPIWGPRSDCYCCQTVAGFLLWGALSDARTGLPFTSAASPHHCSPAGLMTILYCLRFETSQNWRARCPYLYPTEIGWPSYPPGTGFPFRLLVRLAGPRWRYSNPPPQGLLPNSSCIVASQEYRHGPRTEHRLPVVQLLRVTKVLPNNGCVCRAMS